MYTRCFSASWRTNYLSRLRSVFAVQKAFFFGIIQPERLYPDPRSGRWRSRQSLKLKWTLFSGIHQLHSSPCRKRILLFPQCRSMSGTVKRCGGRPVRPLSMHKLPLGGLPTAVEPQSPITTQVSLFGFQPATLPFTMNPGTSLLNSSAHFSSRV